MLGHHSLSQSDGVSQPAFHKFQFTEFTLDKIDETKKATCVGNRLGEFFCDENK